MRGSSSGVQVIVVLATERAQTTTGGFECFSHQIFVLHQYYGIITLISELGTQTPEPETHTRNPKIFQQSNFLNLKIN
jgi:hypothetical protein